MIRLVISQDHRHGRNAAEMLGLDPQRTLIASPSLPESVQRIRGHQFAPDEVLWTDGWSTGARTDRIEDLILNVQACTILATRTEGDT